MAPEEENLSVGRLRWRRFRSVRRAWWSLIVLGALFAVSLLGPLVAGDRPLLMGYEGELFVPVFAFHSDAEFGGSHASEADYVALKSRADFAERYEDAAEQEDESAYRQHRRCD